MKSVRMGDLTVAELRAYLKTNRTVVLPYGVVEQHGYHLPLDTDIQNATVIGERLARRLGCLVAPTVNYCFSGGMLEGTVNIKPTTFCTVIGEIIESLAVQGFRDIVVLPGHGGSESFLMLKESLRVLKWLNPALHDCLVILLPMWEYSPTWMARFRQQDYHAGEVETSLVMSWAPKSVRKQVRLDPAPVARRLRDDPDAYQERQALSALAHEIPSTRQDRRVRVGVMGYPERADAALGRKIIREILDRAAPAVAEAVAEAARNRKRGHRLPVENDSKLKLLSL